VEASGAAGSPQRSNPSESGDLERRSEIPPKPVERLPDALIDQIAAGEVVERPASVVKELVENALDAGATRLEIELRGGGQDFIAVGDDGCGMGPADAALALERHATSKLRSAEDLDRIGTFGFRGEALPAIASVSRLVLRTRCAGAGSATEIAVDHGRRLHQREAAGARGTRVEVADLFAGVPARRKFLKRESTEWGHIAEVLARIALVQPGVRFELRRDERPALVWPEVRDPLDRVAAVISEADAAAFVPLDAEEGGLRIRGFVSRPDRHRPTQAGIYLYVNGRPVRDRLLAHALLDAYRDVLPRGRFPAALLDLALPLERVDVNVHPAKAEVRFADPQQVHRLLRRGAARALAERRWIGVGGAVPGPGDSAAGAWDRAAGSSSERAAGSSEPRRSATGLGSGDWRFAEGPADSAAYAASAARQAELLPAPAHSGAEAPEALRFAGLPLLGQLLGTYLVLEASGQLLLVDQHAAHERVLFERLRAEWRSQSARSQALLVPALLRLSPAASEALLEAEAELRRMGFELERFGPETLALRALPELLAGQDPAALLRNLADELQHAGQSGAGGCGAVRELPAIERMFASIACHSARRKGDLLDPREQRALLEALDAIPWAPTCPHGRPIAVPIAEAEIERRFARR